MERHPTFSHRLEGGSAFENHFRESHTVAHIRRETVKIYPDENLVLLEYYFRPVVVKR